MIADSETSIPQSLCMHNREPVWKRTYHQVRNAYTSLVINRSNSKHRMSLRALHVRCDRRLRLEVNHRLLKHRDLVSDVMEPSRGSILAIPHLQDAIDAAKLVSLWYSRGLEATVTVALHEQRIR